MRVPDTIAPPSVPTGEETPSTPAWRDFWNALTYRDKGKINSKWMALRNALAVLVGLGVGLAIGEPSGAVVAATGALNVSYSDGRDPYRQRARRMLTWTILGAIAVFLGSVTGGYHAAAIFIAAVWAFAAGMSVGVSTRAGDLGLNSLVVLVVFAARGPQTPRGAFQVADVVLTGGLLQTAFALLFWPIRRSDPERRAVGQIYRDLAADIEKGAEAVLGGALKQPSAQAQETLSAIGAEHSTEGERLRLLLDQANRLRLSVSLLTNVRSEVENVAGAGSAGGTQLIDDLLSASAKYLASVGNCLIEDEAVSAEPLNTEIERYIADLDAFGKASKIAVAAEMSAAAESLAGQLRAVAELTSHALPKGREAFEREQATRPMKMRVGNWLDTFRATLNFQSAVFRHALRLSICIAIGDALGRSVNAQRSYWIPMTVAVVLKPDFKTTFSRGLLRLFGTFAGLVLATLLYHAFPASAATQLLLVGVFTFVLRWMGPANYGVFSVAVSGLIVFLIATTGVPPAQVVAQRAIYTAVGGVFALCAYALWPTWERKQVGEVFATMLDSCRDYFRALMQLFDRSDESITEELDERRRTWRRSRSNAEASTDRLASEPRVRRDKIGYLNSMLASSHVLMVAMVGMEAGLLRTRPLEAPEVLRAFAHDVDFTLYFLASALRGSTGATDHLPRLRDDHRRLIDARNSLGAENEFLLAETDRITTTLNTLREQVIRYVS